MNRLIQSVLVALVLCLSFTAHAKSYTPSLKVDCAKEPVACAVYKEARGESVKGQYAVAFVVYNRVNDTRFPKTAKGVVYQRNQFSWTRKHTPVKDKAAFERAREIAREVAALRQTPALYRQKDPTGGAVYFNAKHVRTKHYKRNSRNVAKIGNHVFYGKVVAVKGITHGLKGAS